MMIAYSKIYKVLLLSAILLCAGCTFNNVYEVETLGNKPTNIQGIKHIFEGGAKTVNVVMIHGMGYHPPKVY